MATTVTVTEARAALPDLIDRVLDGEEVTLTRHGTPVAVVVRPDVLRVRRRGARGDVARHVHQLIEDGRNVPLRAEGALSPERGEELLAYVREQRSRD